MIMNNDAEKKIYIYIILKNMYNQNFDFFFLIYGFYK